MPKVVIAENDLCMADMQQEAPAANGDNVCVIARTVETAVVLGERHKPDQYGKHFRKGPRSGAAANDGGPKADIAAKFVDADLADQIRRLRRQQSEIARFSAFAVVCRDLDRVLSEAARVCAECMRVPYCAIYRYRPLEDDLLIAAGFGWDHGTIGRVSSRADGITPHGRAFASGEPVTYDRLSADAGLVRPRLYTAHGIVTTLSVLIISNYQPSASHHGAVETLPYGVLEIASTAQHDYGDDDIEFLSSIANIAAAAVDATKRDTALRVAADRLQDVIEDQRSSSEAANVLPDVVRRSRLEQVQD
jgi:hypothetical protein